MEKYISTGLDTLTRISLKIDDKVYVIESIYSDFDLMEAEMQCIEAAVSDFGISKSVFIEQIKHFIDNDHILIRDYFGVDNITFTTEQYEKRCSCSRKFEGSLVNSLLHCFKSSMVVATYLESAIIDFLQVYADEESELIVMDNKENEEIDN